MNNQNPYFYYDPNYDQFNRQNNLITNNGNNFYPYQNNKNSKVDFKTIIDTTQKTLTTINQIIPLIYQITPLLNNLRTFTKVSKLLKEETNNQ